jgi:hypothetical protein
MASRAGAPCFDNGLAVFDRIRYRRHDGKVSTLLRGSLSGLHLNEHLAHPGDVVFRTPAKWAPRALCPSGSARATDPGARPTGLRTGRANRETRGRGRLGEGMIDYR